MNAPTVVRSTPRHIGTTTADFATTDTPIGPFTALIDTDGIVLASGWTPDAENLRSLIHPTLRPAELRRRDSLGELTRIITDYHAGDLTAIDTVPVRQHSGEFLLHAWEVLRKVPAGAPITYTEYSAISGRPDATRAAANACARNAAALFIPCHRIFRIGGALGGFRWGLPIKRWLLDHEGESRSSLFATT
ncbi:methylated-DNA--[protein]-cysteine S-methyltransferase [Nocardia ninae]|uniref:Putative methylated-DNA:protein-cysteine methyltransferase n=1 Tax=Nocardia ninae NBRC 108245 TaxID=1210091 RepID=A0A511MTF6_9NOCA|nr:methylated-DNA--[protein]-cysteine S-methyltransferase [Nocardia ninae]GEM43854.1 putative methylated-DNA:protein-cysteine methyltransferase [Nocardia ninae NBRC 108245]